MNLEYPEIFEQVDGFEGRYLLLGGGAGSGKSYYTVRRIIKRGATEKGHGFLVLRKVRNTLEGSCIEALIKTIEQYDGYYKFNKSKLDLEFDMKYGAGMQRVYFRGLDKPGNLDSIEGITNGWIEEATQLTEHDFEFYINLRLRGETKYYKQWIFTFNPDESEGEWIKNLWFDNEREDSKVLMTTAWDNDFIDADYLKVLDNIKDPVIRQIKRDGKWGVFAGQVYTHIKKVKEFPKDYDKKYYGLDFGYNNPTALVEIIQKEDVYYVRSLIYETELITKDIIKRFKLLGISTANYIYADTEPDRVEEFKRAGFKKVMPAKKVDKHNGIIDLKGKDIRVLESDGNMNDEIKKYKWKTKRDSTFKDEPAKEKDHLMDAMLYGIRTHDDKKEIKTTGIYIPKTSQLRSNFV